jgi:hypothetical protein
MAAIELGRDRIQAGLVELPYVGTLGRYWRSRPLVFSLVPRRQGLCGAQT